MNTWSGKFFTIAAIAALVCLLGMARAGAYDRADMDKLRQTNVCPGCNLSRANLHKAELAKANLHGADLVEANLSEAKLDGTNLAQADLSGATWTDGRTCAQGSIGECR